MSSIPLDPFSDEPLRLGRSGNEIVIYSVGPNGKDDAAQGDDRVFRLSDQVIELGTTHPRSSPLDLAAVRVRAMLDIEGTDRQLRIAVPWRRLESTRIAISAAATLACLFFVARTVKLLHLILIDDKDGSLGGVLFCSAATLACLYGLAAYWLNRTTIIVSRQEISVRTRHFPLPWVKTAATLMISDVSQLYVQRVQIRNHQGTYLHSEYELAASLRNGERITLFDISAVIGVAREAKEAASLIERRIEAFLNFEDIYVEPEARVRYYSAPPDPL